jgi:two-component system LytT family response regulator
MTIKTIIIDDEQHCIDTLQWQFEKYVDNLELLETFNSPTEALLFLNNNPVDLVFLDIEMPEMNGFELLNKVDKVDFEVIFATAYDEFAIKAFNASAIDYLLKPINKDLLIASIDKVKDKKKPSILPEQMEILYGALSSKAPRKERIAVSTQEGLHFVKITEILYCTSDSNYTNIHLIDGKTILVSRTLKEIEAMLVDLHFLRIHHSHLINLHKIERYIRGDGGYVVMDDKKSLSVSRSRKEALLAMFSG